MAMAQRMTRGQVQDLLVGFATDNPRYRDALMRDPKTGVERQLNIDLGSNNVEPVVDTDDTVHFVLPYAAPEGELEDADLEHIAAGKGNVEASCASTSAAANSATQINL
jgi:hypothetical protein